jgi:hypothetical protein
MAKSTKKASKKVNLDTLDQTHGALQPQRTIGDMLGLRSGYTTESLTEYGSTLRKMDDQEIHAHAIHMGVVPGVNLTRERLYRRLEDRFNDTMGRRFNQPQFTQIMGTPAQPPR